jgi:hypothetical protein
MCHPREPRFIEQLINKPENDERNRRASDEFHGMKPF